MQAIKREQVIFCCAALFCLWLVYDEMTTDRADSRRRSVRSRSAEAPDLTTRSGALLAAGEVSWDSAGRNIFLAPTEESPLPPLVLPPPPLGMLPTTPPQPVGGASPYHRLKSLSRVGVVQGVELPPRPEQAAFEAMLVDDEGESDESITIDPEASDPVASEEGEDEKVLGFRARLKKKKLEQVQAARLKAEQDAEEAKRKLTLDRIYWLNGNEWFGRVTNDASVSTDSTTFDRFSLKLEIDAIRSDSNLSSAQVAQKLGLPEYRVRFRTEREGRPGVFGTEQAFDAGQIRRIVFAEGHVNTFEVRRRQVPLGNLKSHLDITSDLMEAGEFALANAHLKRLMDRHSDGDERLFLAQAQAARQAFDYDTELRALNEGLEKFPGSSDLKAELGNLFSRYHLDQLAENSFLSVIEGGGSQRIAHMYGRHILNTDSPSKERLSRATELLKQAVSGSGLSPMERAKAHTDHGRALMAENQPAAAQGAFENALRADESHLSAQVGLGSAHFASGDIEAARAAFDAALQTSPDCGAAWYGIGLCELEKGSWASARDRFHDAMLADPLLTVDCNIALSFLYEKLGMSGEAADAASAALLADPGHAMASFQMGRIQLGGGDAEQARSLFHVAMAQFPNEFNIIAHMADACFRLQAYQDCLRYIDRALELRREADFLLIRKAHVLARLDRFDAAKVALDRARKLQTGDEVDLSLAFYYYSFGNAQEALKRFGDVVRSLDSKDHTPLAEYAREYEAAIRDNLAMRSWVDRFNRAGKDGLTRGWQIYNAETNVRPSLVRDSILFTGRQKESGRPTCVFQERPGREFVSFEVEVMAAPQDETTTAIGIFQFREARRGSSAQNPIVGKMSGSPAYSGIMLGKTPEGRIGWRTIEKGEISRWKTITGSRWPAATSDGPTPVVLKIELTDQKKRLFSLFAGDQVVASDIKMRDLLQSRRKLQLWLLTQSEIDTQVSCTMDDVRIVTRKGVR